jgi:hypothetical protein
MPAVAVVVDIDLVALVVQVVVVLVEIQVVLVQLLRVFLVLQIVAQEVVVAVQNWIQVAVAQEL